MRSQLSLIALSCVPSASPGCPRHSHSGTGMDIPAQAPILLSLFGPLEAAILWAGVEGGRRGIKEFLARFFVAGFNPLWYLVAMLLPLGSGGPARR